MEETTRLPVFRAYASVWAVILTRFVDVLRIAALPAALSTALLYWFMPRLLGVIADMPVIDPEDAAGMEEMLAFVGNVSVLGLGLACATAVVNAIAFAGLLRMLIRGETPRLPVYLDVGRHEFNILVCWLAVSLIGFGVSLAEGMVRGLLVAVLGPVGGGISSLALSIASAVVNVWVSLRLSLAPAASVSHGKIGVRESWRASVGQSWTLLGFWVLIGGTMLIVMMVVMFALPAPPVEGQVVRPPAGGEPTPEMIRDIYSGMARSLLGLFDLSTTMGVIRAVAFFLLQLAWTAVAAVAGGVAWRIITDDKPPVDAPSKA